MSSLVAVLAGLGVVVLVAIGVGVAAQVRHRRWGPMTGGHAHNDYRHHRPLLAALDQGFTSVEVDIWPHQDADGTPTLLVGHDEADLERWRTLRGLYLDPLARRVAAQGRVQPGYDRPFQLLVEIKNDPEWCWELLAAELDEYSSMLTRFEGDEIHPGAVTVVITGKPPREALAAAPVRYAACDGSLSAVGSDLPASLVPLCSEKWSWKFQWDGRGEMPAEEREKLRDWVAKAHAEGRTVRFWGVPAHSRKTRNAFWREMREAKVDYLGTDDLAALRAFMTTR
ncbi:phosphatidylinositol-specific phospholipase C/glycerophosphodiester phosphodiesterase family protein [Cryptosporangium phraense]|uniref:Altered inheritance of mitochondria protein 6 n=1 Tax=Cryptosporangium phraense TaxID=2593070 RepID=A0A545AVL5_9ACTN|nr:phosphatidylinositol-specific phospholipase C/glycerophosphodiester phosphodiesterase family protein [Cryptosporangium phraense]TQS45363.1 hypothetical protein FL583_09775 [Cryptosporangium phraense]